MHPAGDSDTERARVLSLHQPLITVQRLWKTSVCIECPRSSAEVANEIFKVIKLVGAHSVVFHRHDHADCRFR